LSTPAERIASVALSRILDSLPPGAFIEDSEDLRELLSALERYLSELLQRAYPEDWRFEGLDGFYLARAMKTGDRTAELSGMCILVTDQTLTPFQVGLRVAAAGDCLEWVHCRLGERAEAGMLRMAYASTKWGKRMHGLNFSTVDWVYEVEIPSEDAKKEFDDD
jgi:hypothetical protein